MINLNKHIKLIFPYVLLTLGLSLVYFVTRLVNLTIIPIFTDEAIYLRWGQIALADPRWRFISLVDGKQPLFIWLLLPMLKVMSDPLIAGRLLSIIAGFTGMVGISVFGWYLTRKMRGVIIGGLLYLIIPFFLMYDRLAIYDALLAAIAIWVLFFTYLFALKQRLDLALILGTFIGAGLLTKSSANFFWMLLPLTLLITPWPTKKRGANLFKWLLLCLVIIFQAQIYNNILRLSEFRHIIAQKNLEFIYTPAEFLRAPLSHLYNNLKSLTSWLVGYLTPLLSLLILAANIWYIRHNLRRALFFLGYFIIPFFALAAFGRVIYPRFILFMVFPLLIPTIIFGDHLLATIRHRTWLMIATVLLISPLIWFDRQIIFDPIHAPIPSTDRQQYINDWPAGYGIKEAVAYLDEASKHGQILVGTEGTFGLYPMALELYLGKNPNVKFDPIWPIGGDFPKQLQEAAKVQPTYLLFKERQQIPEYWPLKLIAQYQRGDGPTYLKFYRVLP
ncbi:MAG: hypothetical protein UV61_C0002G0121 [Candidatus Gottesmanbacteria bacterium GW2011_GWB1_43_11]|uniref:Glycosyltransferase RgtA/B/C/D-like domain-containing protein n=1 Tax=Candidatus Gottesmanbacteria bacterium GW2011_GWB1_43_11 TaxID=1618446 RepID=A0A0G1CNQ0_9BACT|nr:MAG: hypothetical protein UV04_C0001G0009 [Candidatus Gottesmanbacteria bacterium GW2011_GWA2_42_16]KKS56197.1 MAG: hypothetical protein UV17_C0001G0007 [Candidatus Gottesmanbacteria bacterium GW2011_GWA1_42_26]KKS81795.1 MAG: hypothetical protein UV55_C0008G0010 [Candidatus Gottesmanbacteria bacterium GW2011_GWC1_43_10]KKS87400.1 MAG: hypothetical protein UV61_C0002G0121 [Candidatus Gottesmanbacteria bacterium GW2011_GWB1_43_11]OGG10225.1 MAG: hypothetical protein A2699_01600 [Candidatus Go